MMIRLRDEILVAYADGELSRDMRHVVERVLEQDVQARRSVALFRLTARCARRAFASIDDGRMPVALAGYAGAGQGRRRRLGGRTRLAEIQLLGLLAALAACFVLGIAVGELSKERGRQAADTEAASPAAGGGLAHDRDSRGVGEVLRHGYAPAEYTGEPASDAQQVTSESGRKTASP